MNSSPFALFVLDKSIDNETLERARSWDAANEADWDLWLATNSYEDMPRDPPNRRQPDGSVLPAAHGTVPPISKSYVSPWYGKTVEDCARWLQAAPDDVASDKQHFAAMNEYSREDDTVLLCRVKKTDGEAGWKVDYYPVWTVHVAMALHTRNGTSFEESFGGYQRKMEGEGKPDRSQGGPYS
ncbi:hypothetical protein SNOG_01873 [Parastagonospora nodorum SN15]|uniref:Uncharacterized protein n=1 Tax=Phaeosphaeria nodorum (strain SN15 / ATCC MYA-4574 / FGSC 10173) TaxID=321614 RepID=Q0V291_PHANO|nr:hypothetical protein SNOG_01873 [Parastagonospora nodorum SN15]EAT90085.1 hypothetical protein SNOG_01873 [Parastagonospora nodorum SN15]